MEAEPRTEHTMTTYASVTDIPTTVSADRQAATLAYRATRRAMARAYKARAAMDWSHPGVTDAIRAVAEAERANDEARFVATFARPTEVAHYSRKRKRVKMDRNEALYT